MTAARAGPRPFSLFSGQGYGHHRGRPAFLFSFVAQGVTVGLLVYFTCRIIGNQPTTLPGLNRLGDLPLIFSRRRRPLR